MQLRFGTAVDPALPRDRLVDKEREELKRLLVQRESLSERLGMVEQQVQLLLLHIRDRRGWAGEVQVDPESGLIGVVEVKNANY